MSDEVLNILERIAENGTAPEEGCSLFGVEYQSAFDRLRKVYLEKAFKRGRSAEKFVVGPFGSGKTHFLRQLMEIARGQVGCATSEIALNRDIDYTKTLMVYSEVARELRPPNSQSRGIPALIDAAIENVRARAEGDRGMAQALLQRWVAGLELADFEEHSFTRVLRGCLDARLADEHDSFDNHCRWLEGEVTDRKLAGKVGAAVVVRAEQPRYGRRALQSLCQFIRYAGFAGTVIGFDEAEQGFSVTLKRMDALLSMLQSSINATADLRDGSTLIVYALTPDIAEKMENFSALQQRVADPSPGQGFFNGQNTRAPKIDLTWREDPVGELNAIGRKFVDLLYDTFGSELVLDKAQVYQEVLTIAEDVAKDDATASNRRTMARRTCTILLRLYEEGSLDSMPSEQHEPEDPEV